MNSSTVVEPTLADTDSAARLFAALGDPARLRILSVLATSQRCVCDIQSAAPMAANLLSYHLKALREAGLIHGTRRGRFIDYCLTDDVAGRVAGALGAAGLVASIEQPPGCTAGCEPRR